MTNAAKQLAQRREIIDQEPQSGGDTNDGGQDGNEPPPMGDNDVPF